MGNNIFCLKIAHCLTTNKISELNKKNFTVAVFNENGLTIMEIEIIPDIKKFMIINNSHLAFTIIMPDVKIDILTQLVKIFSDPDKIELYKGALSNFEEMNMDVLFPDQSEMTLQEISNFDQIFGEKFNEILRLNNFVDFWAGSYIGLYQNLNSAIPNFINEDTLMKDVYEIANSVSISKLPHLMLYSSSDSPIKIELFNLPTKSIEEDKIVFSDIIKDVFLPSDGIINLDMDGSNCEKIPYSISLNKPPDINIGDKDFFKQSIKFYYSLPNKKISLEII